MSRLVFMVFSYDTVCFPSSTPYRVVTAGASCAVTTRGAHRASLVASLTGFLSEHGVEIDDFEEAEGDDCYAMILVGRATSPHVHLADLRTRLHEHGKNLGVTVRVQRADLFMAMHRI